jgi:hypothetical protein
MPAKPLIACRSVSVRDELSIPAVEMPNKPANDIAIVTIEAQIVRDRYQGFIASIRISFQLKKRGDGLSQG